MPYVFRDDGGKVSGTSRYKPTNAPEEFLESDDPEVIECKAAMDAEFRRVSVSDEMALLAVLNDKGLVTQTDLDTKKKELS